ncbi:hypothetical protein ABB34_13755 [Stenotrophomonas daejeonensis]|uniref:Peptidase A2 domain-containing protein n=1 Tax=Stenotrophomonas daejeonensis TaxID=659018 RepID=A0A0R0DY86_9GAMM|nr:MULTISPECIES: hypothetical protein [Stenotrophomonas]KRG82392.1 hypothetical protein ABB34_13755 [Stenotrophomonas daejeonensis]MCG8275466.1 hypothetical protein [Stenotrophomonas sp. NLF4-10]
MKLPSRCTTVAAAMLLTIAPTSVVVAARSGESREAPARTRLPTRFEHQRIFVAPRSADGTTVLFYTDSGGGLNMIREDAALRLGLAAGADVVEQGHPPIRTVQWPTFAGDADLPAAEHDRFLEGRLAVVPEEGFGEGPMLDEGFLGSRWFAGRVWEFDYPSRSLSILEGWQAPANARSTPLTMLPNHDMYWPRVQVEIDGEQLDLLFDTGAELRLGPDGARALGRREGARVAGSFITARQYRKWRDAHPDWPVALKGDGAMPMIQVPNVRIAGADAGPAWFAMRPDRSFTEYMSSMTDAPVEGAIGGSAFSRLRMVADYPAQTLYVLP